MGPPSSGEGQASSPMPIKRGGVSSLMSRGCSPQVSEGWGQLGTALVFQHMILQHMIHMGSSGNTGNGHEHRTPAATGPRTCSWPAAVAWTRMSSCAQGDNTGFSGQHESSSSVIPQTPAWSQMAAQTPGSDTAFNGTGATDINTDPGCSRATDPDMNPDQTQVQTSPWPWVAA